MGSVYGHFLTNTKFDSSLLYLRIKDSVHRAKIWIQVDRGIAVRRALALDNEFVCAIFSHLRCFTWRALARLKWRHIVYVVQTAMAHSACMRYGHFSAVNPLRANLRRSPLAHACRFESAWDKFVKGDMVVIFYYDRPTSEAGVYHLQTPPEFVNDVSVTVSMVLQWLLSSTGLSPQPATQ